MDATLGHSCLRESHIMSPLLQCLQHLPSQQLTRAIAAARGAGARSKVVNIISNASRWRLVTRTSVEQYFLPFRNCYLVTLHTHLPPTVMILNDVVARCTSCGGGIISVVIISIAIIVFVIVTMTSIPTRCG